MLPGAIGEGFHHNVFITQKFTHYKTSRTLKLDVLKISDNENTEKLFLKYEQLFLDQANSSSNPSQILILQLPIRRTSLLPQHLCQILPQPTETLTNTNLIMFFIGFNILSYSIRPQATASIGYTKSDIKPSQSNLLSSFIQIMIPYGLNTLPIKKLSH